MTPEERALVNEVRPRIIELREELRLLAPTSKAADGVGRELQHILGVFTDMVYTYTYPNSLRELKQQVTIFCNGFTRKLSDLGGLFLGEIEMYREFGNDPNRCSVLRSEGIPGTHSWRTWREDIGERPDEGRVRKILELMDGLRWTMKDAWSRRPEREAV